MTNNEVNKSFLTLIRSEKEVQVDLKVMEQCHAAGCRCPLNQNIDDVLCFPFQVINEFYSTHPEFRKE
jgi:hypothetical protein